MANGATIAPPNQSPAHPGKAQGGTDSKGAQLVPFIRASREHVEPGGLDKTVVLNAGAQQLGSEDVVAFGYARAIVLLVDATGGDGGAAVVAKAADAPWSVLDQVTLTDVNGAALVSLSGYELYLAHKYGGGAFSPDPTASPQFSDVATGNGASGNFSFLLRIPLEVVAREGVGALENMSAASTYKLQITVAASAKVYTTAPATTLPSVRVRSFLEAWTPPAAADARGNAQETEPPGKGTTQFWTSTNKVIANGQNTIGMSRVGNLIRNTILVFRDSGQARSTNKMPDPLQFLYDGVIVWTIPRIMLQHYMAERYGFAAANLDVGVIVVDHTHDFDGHPGGELMDLYLPTTQGTRAEFVGEFADTGSLTVITNDINPGPGVLL